MPWESKTVEEIRKEFITAAQISKNFSSLCRDFGITRKTGYKWLDRWQQEQNLSDRSHARKIVSNKTDEMTEKLILSVREANPTWGGKTIRQVLLNQGHAKLPCVKTCNNIIKRNGLVLPEESLKHTPFVRYEKDHCNEMWQTDFQGRFCVA
ncbi:MAG: hypothetical protein LRY68_06865 [Sulfurospirillum sp.]|nr:hypothetical protein [Sulfurospirillum sp.]